MPAFTLPPTPELSAINGQVGGIPGMPEGPTYEERRKQLAKPEDVSKEEAKMLQRQNELERQIGEAKQAQEQYLAGTESRIATQTREQAEKIESDLDKVRKEFPYPDFHPTKENTQSLATLFSLIGVVGFAMGGVGKMSAMNSLKSMTGMMQGWQQGRKDLWEREKAEFDKNMAKTKAVLEDAYRDADRAYKTLAYNREEAQRIAAESAAKLGGQVGKQILEKQGIENYFKYLSGVRTDLNAAIQESHRKEREAFEREKFKWQQKQDIERRQIDRERLRLEKVKAELKNNGMDASQFIQSSTGARLKDKDANEVLKTSMAIGHAYALKEMVAQHPDWVGRSGQIQQFFNRYLDSLKSGKPLPDDDPNLAKDKSGQDALVFAKDYASYLVDYEQALAGGAKGFTVSFQNRFNKLMEQNQFNPQGFDKLMDQQIDEMARKAIVKSPSNLNKENITKMGLVINRDDPNSIKGYQRFSGKAPSNTVTVGEKTYSRPSNFTDQQWEDYKKAVGAK